jgi:hypothetical protein
MEGGGSLKVGTKERTIVSGWPTDGATEHVHTPTHARTHRHVFRSLARAGVR